MSPILAVLFCASSAVYAKVVDHDAAISSAQDSIKFGDFATAEKTLQNVVKDFPDSYDAIYLLAVSLCGQSKFAEEQRLSEKFKDITDTPEFRDLNNSCKSQSQLLDAQKLLGMGRTADAIKILIPLYRSGPDSYAAGLALATAYQKQKENQKALKVYSELQKTYPDDVDIKNAYKKLTFEVRLSKARSLLKAGNVDGAIEAARPLYLSGPDFYSAGLILASAYIEKNDLVEAAQIYEALKKKYPKDKGLDGLAEKMYAEDKLNKAREMLKAGNVDNAIAIAQPLYLSGPDQYSAGLLLASAYIEKNDLVEAAKIYEALKKKYPQDTGLDGLAEKMYAEEKLNKAREMLKAGDPEGAIEIAEPLYVSGPDSYSAGLILASAYVANSEPQKAGEIFNTLVSKYPQDDELQAMKVKSLLDAKESELAQEEYSKLNPIQRVLAYEILGGTLNPLYPNSIMLYGGVATSSNNYPNDNTQGISLNKQLGVGVLNLIAEHDYRYNSNATAFAANYSWGTKGGYNFLLGAGTSPQNTYLAHYSAVGMVGKTIGDYSPYIGVQQLNFANSHATVYWPGIAMNLTPNFTLDTRYYYVPSTGAYSFLVSPQWNDGLGNKTFLTVTAGTASDQLGVVGGLLKYPSNSVRAGKIWRVDPQVSLGADVFYETRSGLYNRLGTNFSVIYWW